MAGGSIVVKTNCPATCYSVTISRCISGVHSLAAERGSVSRSNVGVIKRVRLFQRIMAGKMAVAVRSPFFPKLDLKTRRKVKPVPDSVP
jgi:hypothetical protein